MDAEAVFDGPIEAEAVLLAPEAMPSMPISTTIDVQTQTDQGLESVQHLCRALNAANRKIGRSNMPTDDTNEARRALSLDQLTPSSKTRRAKEIADKLQQCFRPKSLLEEANKFLRLARHQADFKSAKKATKKRTKKGRTRPSNVHLVLPSYPYQNLVEFEEF
uniref:Uncharacterized protein n=1 Tax=Globodera rostochiensis TaxID=31243 RepID=A0A914H6P7_GLORO